MSKPLFVFFLSTFVTVTLWGQRKERFLINGTIVDEKGEKMAFVHIWNESARIMSISDSSGIFRIRASAGDTLAFGALGYFGKVEVITDKELKEGLEITLNSRIMTLLEVKVIGFRSYADFKQKFINLKLPETEAEKLRRQFGAGMC
ncbi:MAG: hypothetical protein HC906_08245 [Bacteroidales bacterium]|nr:hypothetical protein [Bacteroidales bacterium]